MSIYIVEIVNQFPVNSVWVSFICLFYNADLIVLVCYPKTIPGHPWISENGVAPDRALDPAVLSRLKQFSAMNRLKKMALRVCNMHHISFL